MKNQELNRLALFEIITSTRKECQLLLKGLNKPSGLKRKNSYLGVLAVSLKKNLGIKDHSN